MDARRQFLQGLTTRFGRAVRLKPSQSLLEIPAGRVRLYLRYSRVHERGATFYGLREKDLRELEGHTSFICLLWEGQTEPLLLPFAEYEDIFQALQPGDDGQYKAHLYLRDTGTDFAINRAGRFNVDAHFGWTELETAAEAASAPPPTQLSHPAVQTLLAAIGMAKDYRVWIPPHDRERVGVAGLFSDRSAVAGRELRDALEQLDVVWLDRGSGDLRAVFEVEHSTSIYSGLLRFNDIYLLTDRRHNVRFTIVSDEERRSAFVRQVNRPTFQASSLSQTCTFLDYSNLVRWHQRVCGERPRDVGPNPPAC